MKKQYHKVGRHSVLVAESKHAGCNMVLGTGRICHYGSFTAAMKAVKFMQKEISEKSL